MVVLIIVGVLMMMIIKVLFIIGLLFISGCSCIPNTIYVNNTIYLPYNGSVVNETFIIPECNSSNYLVINTNHYNDSVMNISLKCYKVYR